MKKVFACILTLSLLTVLFLLSIGSSDVAFRKRKSSQVTQIEGPAATLRETTVLTSPTTDSPEWNAFNKECTRRGLFKSCGYKIKGETFYKSECCAAENCITERNGEGEWKNRCPPNTLISVKYLVYEKEKLVLDSPYPDSKEWNGFVSSCKALGNTSACGWSERSEKNYHIQCCRAKDCKTGKYFFDGKKIVGQYYWQGNTAIQYYWNNFCPDGTEFSLKYVY